MLTLNHSEGILDQVTLVGPNDIQALKLHIMATRVNNKFIDRTFYILADIPEVKTCVESLKRDLSSEYLDNVVFINETEILDPAICSNKWIYQQLLKLSIDKLRNTHELSEPFLFTDVDTLCLRKTELSDIQRDGKYLFFAASDNDEAVYADNFAGLPVEHKERDPGYKSWYWAMSWTSFQLLGLEKAPFLCAVDAFVIWSQKVLKKLKKHIEDHYHLRWEEVIIQQFSFFICSFRNNFFYDSKNIRSITFSLQHKRDLMNGGPGFDELYHKLRLGFSEWQLYTYFLSTLESSIYKINLLGDSPHPLVGECSCHKDDHNLLKKILKASESDSGPYPNFVYCYPDISAERATLIEESLKKKI